MTRLEKIPSFAEASRDFVAGCASIASQSVGIGLSGLNMFLSLFKNKRVDNYHNMLITGASSGIGRSLAIKFASTPPAEGNRRLVLQGRNNDRLQEVADVCTQHGCQVLTIVADFSIPDDLSAFVSFVKRHDAERPFDLIVANAGMLIYNLSTTASATAMSTSTSDTDQSSPEEPSSPESSLPERLPSQGSSPESSSESSSSPEVVYSQVIDANLKGILATFFPVLDNMKARDAGHVVLLSSINAYLGPSNQYLYSATKSFIRTLGQDLAQDLRRNKSAVRISVVAPGLVDTRMTSAFWESDDAQDRAKIPRGLAQDPDKFAAKVYNGIVRQDGFITYPYYQFYQAYLGGTLPPTLRQMTSCIMGKANLLGSRTT